MEHYCLRTSKLDHEWGHSQGLCIDLEILIVDRNADEAFGQASISMRKGGKYKNSADSW